MRGKLGTVPNYLRRCDGTLGDYGVDDSGLWRLCRAGLAQDRHLPRPAAGGALGPARGAPGARGDDGLPAVAHGGRRVEAGDHACGDLPRFLRAPRAQAPPHRHRLRPACHHPRRGRCRLRGVQGLRRGRGAGGGGVCVLAALRAEAAAPGAQPRGDPHPLAHRRDRGLRLPVRRHPLRGLRGRPGDRARARLGAGWGGRRHALRRGIARRAGDRAAGELLGADDHGVLLPRAAAAGRALPHRDGAAGALPGARHAGESRALRRPGGDHGRRRGRRHEGRRAGPRPTSSGRRPSTPSPAPSAAAARIPVPPS